jgi:phosphatidylserine/phosphatidylglycerophosphate/cardiolipin synthase-like enzyme/uncharacterized membrane protein YdjX (TVP38/TMEM64 family)
MIAVPGRNCWRQEQASRAAFLIDGEAYFDAFAAAAERAEHSIIVLAWDFHGGVCLRAGDVTTRLDTFLNELLVRRRHLNVYILDWDYPPLYAAERQVFPAYRFQWWTHRRFHFQLDAQHAPGGSHHQKVVVIDDAIAFVGGIDFAPGRWDTPSHTGDDARRVTPSGAPCGPYHDLMVAVDGDAAAALGVLARERWYRATGQHLPPAPTRADRWPECVRVDLRDVTVSIARTLPESTDRAEVREIETLYTDAIAAAQKWIYIESQYLTAEHVARALRRRLQEPTGPEVVVVTTQVCGGWLEEGTMGVLRARLVQRLVAADRFHRLRLFAPNVPGLTNSRYTVHAKAMIVDDELARVGSANLNNRSMGLDSECDVAMEANGDVEVARGIALFRNRLLAEHLCVEVETVAAELARTNSLIATIEQLRNGEHTLLPLDPTVPEWLDGLMPEAAIVDPDRPVDAQVFFEGIAPVAPAVATRSRRWVFIVVAVVLLAAAWSSAHYPWSPELVADWFAKLGGHALSPVFAIGFFVIGALLFIPVTILILAAGVVFGPWHGLWYAAIGSLLSALIGFGVGRAMGHEGLRRVAGGRFERLRLRLARHGILTGVAVRILPLAPFTIVNVVAGIAGLRVRDFMLATLIGMSPGIVGLTLFGDQLADATRSPTRANVLMAAGWAVLLIVLGSLMAKRLAPRPRHRRWRPRRLSKVARRSKRGMASRYSAGGKMSAQIGR